jgi:hypothetical protein
VTTIKLIVHPLMVYGGGNMNSKPPVLPSYSQMDRISIGNPDLCRNEESKRYRPNGLERKFFVLNDRYSAASPPAKGANLYFYL